MKAADLDLGHDHHLRYWVFSSRPDVGPAGAIITHPSKTDIGLTCEGGITFALDATADLVSGPRWVIVDRDPLTLTPSLLCIDCGDHGYVTNGKWVPVL